MHVEHGPTILIIDNDEGVVRAISTRLESLGYHCISASSGAQGRAAFTDADIDLIISDLNMPAGDGIALAGAVREVSNTPIIFVTGFREDFRRELRSINNVTLLEKPFETGQLIELVEAELVMAGRELP